MEFIGVGAVLHADPLLS